MEAIMAIVRFNTLCAAAVAATAEVPWERGAQEQKLPTLQTLRLTFGTKARKRRGLSFMICRRTSSLAPAFLILGTKTVSVFA
jgi:hypothetical protein